MSESFPATFHIYFQKTFDSPKKNQEVFSKNYPNTVKICDFFNTFCGRNNYHAKNNISVKAIKIRGCIVSGQRSNNIVVVYH